VNAKKFDCAPAERLYKTSSDGEHVSRSELPLLPDSAVKDAARGLLPAAKRQQARRQANRLR
jgi:hypothetical protein